MEKKYDAIIVGGGPAGLSAAIYLARAQFNVLVVERDAIGGQIVITGEVVNYPGILATNGKNLTADMHRQAENFGATFLSAEVTGLELSAPIRQYILLVVIFQHRELFMQQVHIPEQPVLKGKKILKVTV